MTENQNIYSQVLIGEVVANPCGVNSVSWNKNLLECEMIAVGGNNSDNPYNKLLDHSDNRTTNVR